LKISNVCYLLIQNILTSFPIWNSIEEINWIQLRTYVNRICKHIIQSNRKEKFIGNIFDLRLVFFTKSIHIKSIDFNLKLSQFNSNHILFYSKFIYIKSVMCTLGAHDRRSRSRSRKFSRSTKTETLALTISMTLERHRAFNHSLRCNLRNFQKL
jgi:hypothetical protein